VLDAVTQPDKELRVLPKRIVRVRSVMPPKLFRNGLDLYPGNASLETVMSALAVKSCMG
jgi:hypothetical protein